MNIKVWDKDRIIREIIVSNNNGLSLSSRSVAKRDSALMAAAWRYFGGWRQAVEAAGIAYDKLKRVGGPVPIWSRIQVIRRIRSLKRAGLPVNFSGVDRALYAAARNYFGTWKAAAEAAGIDLKDTDTTIVWDKEKIVEAILLRHSDNLPLYTRSLQRDNNALLQAAGYHFGGWRQAVEAAGIEYNSVRSPKQAVLKWNKDELIKVIRGLKNRGVPLNFSYVAKSKSGLVKAARRIFGGWRQAVEAAGITYDDGRSKAKPKKQKRRSKSKSTHRKIASVTGHSKKWSQDKIVEAILDHKTKGLPLNSNSIQQNDTALYQAGCKYFGSWQKAIEAAGLNYDDVRSKTRLRKWGKERVVNIIQSRHENLEPLNSNYVQLHENNLYAAGCKYFGSWQKAIEAAGLNYSYVRLKAPMRSWTKQLIVKEIKRRKRGKLSLNSLQVIKDDDGLYRAVARHFGRDGWKKALKAAGVNPKDIDPHRKWTKRKIFARMRKYHKQGIPLYAYHLVKIGEANFVEGARKYFGSWRKAIEAFGLKWKDIRGVKKYHWWTPNRVTARIRYWNNRGVQLSSKSVRLAHADLFGAAITYFGSWSKAVYAAGINYLEHSKTWSYKAWAGQLTSEELTELKIQSKEFAQRRGRNDKRNSKISDNI